MKAIRRDDMRCRWDRTLSDPSECRRPRHSLAKKTLCIPDDVDGNNIDRAKEMKEANQCVAGSEPAAWILFASGNWFFRKGLVMTSQVPPTQSSCLESLTVGSLHITYQQWHCPNPLASQVRRGPCLVSSDVCQQF